MISKNQDNKLVMQEFVAFTQKLVVLSHMKRSNTLVTVGSDENLCIKFWRVDTNEPTVLKTIKLDLSPGSNSQITALSCMEDLSQIAVGMQTGHVVLIDAPLQRSTKFVPLCGAGPAITALMFRDKENDSAPPSLFVVTKNTVMSYFTRGLKNLKPLELDSDGGGEAGCSVLDDEWHLLCGRDVGTCFTVYFFTAEERTVCWAFDPGNKFVGWFGKYLYLVRNEDRKDVLTLFDLRIKYKAFEGKFEPILHIASEWGVLFVVTTSAKGPGVDIHKLSEKDLNSKVKTLRAQKMFDVALHLARAQGCDDTYLHEIHKSYADYHLTKHAFGDAIEQFIETIPTVEPSYVIRKFLDAQRIKNLTAYLQALHNKKVANQDHTTLLLNCYTKLKDVEHLEVFVRSDNSLFDVPTAIAVLRKAEYFDQALLLAMRHRIHDVAMAILVEDLLDFDQALRYIWSLPKPLVVQFVGQHGQKFVDQRTEDATELLKSLCTVYNPRPFESAQATTVTQPAPSPSASVSRTTTPAQQAAPIPAPDKQVAVNVDDYIHFFLDKASHLQSFLEYVVAKDTQCTQLVYHTLLELYLRAGEGECDDADDEKGDEHISAMSDKIMNLLRSRQAKYNLDHALVLTKMYRFGRGVTYLYERLNLYTEILQYHIERGQHSKIVKTCKKWGESEPQLWVLALTYFANADEAVASSCEQQIVEVLSHIEAQRLLAPLMVVQTLARNHRKPLSVIKDYIIRTLLQEDQMIEQDAREIKEYQHQTAEMRRQLEDLETSATAFQELKCHQCSQPLDFPSVHFLCKHQFHQHCLGDHHQCNRCAPEHNKVMDIRSKQKAGSKDHDRFFKQLDGSNDGFSIVAEYFGRGIFNADDSANA